jgi:hypothetical protein
MPGGEEDPILEQVDVAKGVHLVLHLMASAEEGDLLDRWT